MVTHEAKTMCLTRKDEESLRTSKREVMRIVQGRRKYEKMNIGETYCETGETLSGEDMVKL